jgi:NAD-dependent dihydropyrimidine dehydrogenase PreA subunit
MKVLINYKICDNSPACSGIEVCPTGALFWDESADTIGYDESKCVGCGACVNACPVRAILLARDDAAAANIQADIDSDPRTVADLFCDRYGSDICDTLASPPGQALAAAKNTAGLAVLELYDEATLRCLTTSIPMTEIFGND